MRKRKDSAFKAIIEDTVSKSHNDFLSENNINFRDYRPDGVINYKNHYFLIEHSSTGNRKAHIGELLQAFVFSKENKIISTLILILDNSNRTAPKPDTEFDRLTYYLDSLDKDRSNLKRIIVKSIQDIMSAQDLDNLIRRSL